MTLSPQYNWTDEQLILASQSPRRKKILEMIGVNFSIHKSQYDEERIPGKSPAALAKIHARKKATDVAQHYSHGLVIGADTIVVIDEKILEKPINRSHAIAMLKTLSNRTHLVMTGVGIVNAKNQQTLSFVDKTAVTFAAISDEMLVHYLDNYQYKDKAGSYAIQDFSSLFVQEIRGSFYNVVGFPIARFFHFMTKNADKIL